MKTLINVLGAGYSGTTMLDLMLGNDPRSFSLGEVHAWFRPFRTHHFKIKCSCGSEPCPYWEKIKYFPESEFHDRAFKELDVDFLIDSSKDLAWIIDNNIWASSNGIRVYNLLIFKHPVDHSYSSWKRNKSMISLRNWKNWTLYHKRFLKMKIPYFSVNFDDLVLYPNDKLEEICALVGMQYFEGKECFWTKSHHHLFGSLGTRRQVEKQKSYFKSPKQYNSDFIDKEKNLRKKYDKNETVRLIMETLKSNEISQNKTETNSIRPSIPPRYPGWYFFSKFQKKIRRHFPQKWPYDQ